MPDLKYLTGSKADRFVLKPGQKTMKAVVTTGNGGYDKLDLSRGSDAGDRVG